MYIQTLANVHSDTEGNIVKKVSTPKGDLNNIAHVRSNITICLVLIAFN